MKSYKLILITIAVVCSFTAFAQSTAPIAQLTDKNVRTGTLNNGLTYYVLHNEFPKGQANFHIAQKVGAVQEEEYQNGLAHFLEHMCFNGTENFPDKLILTWLETIGVKFGYNLNAHTGTDQTVYDITNVPVSRESIIDSCLLILHDWADALTLADDEINKERGVIHEEWRMGNGAVSRLLNRHAPKLYPGTKYATHDVIGSMDIIDNFDPQVLRDYYEKWYRPDLQGIIVVGDIDVDAVEQKIKDLFSPIKMPSNPAPFTYQKVPDNAEPVIISDKDAELPYNILLVAQKYDLLPRELRNTENSFVIDFMENVVSNVLNQRFTEIAMSSDAPFAGCSADFSSFLYAHTKGALFIETMINDKGTEAAETTVLTELLRLKRFGITASEFDRARNEYMSALANLYNNRNSEKNAAHAQRLINHFLENDPIADITTEYEFLQKVAPMVSAEQVNAYIASLFIPAEASSLPATGSNDLGYNLVIFSLAPDKEGINVPTAEALAQVLANVNKASIEAYVDNIVTEPLIATLPPKGKVLHTEQNTTLGYTILTLSNGAKVILKPTDFKENEIRLSAFSKGGLAPYSAEDYPSGKMAADMLTATGLSKFSRTDLQKMMSGIQASVVPSIGGYSESVSGSSTKQDLETMMQLLYLIFTSPREDETTFNNLKKLYSDQLANISLNPQYVFADSATRILYNHHPKAQRETSELINKVDYKRALEIYKERFGNAGDFTFFLTGSFTLNDIIPLIEQYIASLPSTGIKENYVDDGKHEVKGNVRKQFIYPNEGEQAMLLMRWGAEMPYTAENIIKTSVLSQIMSNALLSSVREDEGAAYSPMSYGSMSNEGSPEVEITTSFGLNPDKYKTSEQLTIAALETLADSVSDTELSKMKEYMLKQIEENEKDNRYWIGIMKLNEIDGVDSNTNYRAIVKSLKPIDIQNHAKEILKSGNRFELLMLPK